MSRTFEEYRKDFIEINLCDKKLICYEEYNKLQSKSDYKHENGVYYKVVPMEITDDQLNQFIAMKNFVETKELNKRMNTVKNILVFWLVIGIIGAIFAAANLLNSASY